MSGVDLVNTVLLPIGLGLFGFIEPCSIGSTLVFVKALEGRPAVAKIVQTSIFAVTRGVFIGFLGMLAVVVGAGFLGLQKAAWVLLGLLYAAVGLLYLTGRAALVMTSLGPGLSRLSGLGGSAGLGVFFGLNIPACAAPLLFALLGTAAASGAGGAALAEGFASLGLFGLALSLPLVVAVLFARARGLLDWLAGLSRRIPRWTGLLMILLGAWSIWFGLFVSIKP
jgi:cytochrome c-type biogenesis protein